MILRVVGVAAQGDLDQLGATAGGRQFIDLLGSADGGGVRQLRRPAAQLRGGGGGARGALRTDQDVLDGGIAETGVVDPLLRTRGVADA